MTFFAAVYGQETGKPQAMWVARARAERGESYGRRPRVWAEPAMRSDRFSARPGTAPVIALPHQGDRERHDEDGERWDGLS